MTVSGARAIRSEPSQSGRKVHASPVRRRDGGTSTARERPRAARARGATERRRSPSLVSIDTAVDGAPHEESSRGPSWADATDVSRLESRTETSEVSITLIEPPPITASGGGVGEEVLAPEVDGRAYVPLARHHLEEPAPRPRRRRRGRTIDGLTLLPTRATRGRQRRIERLLPLVVAFSVGLALAFALLTQCAPLVDARRVLFAPQSPGAVIFFASADRIDASAAAAASMAPSPTSSLSR